MKMMLWLTLGLVGFFSATPAGSAQVAAASAPAYADENQVDPKPLKLSALAGKVGDLGGFAMPMASVSLFTEEGHTLIATVKSDRNGEFRFDKVAHGLYRVVARVEGLCTANIPIKLESSLIAHRKLHITMQPKGLDTCSYGMTK